MIAVDNDDVVTHDEILVATPFGVDCDESFRYLDDSHIVWHDRAGSQSEVDIVGPRHVATAQNVLTDLGSLCRSEVHRTSFTLALLGLALALVLALLTLILRVALLSLALLGLALALVLALPVLTLTLVLAFPLALRGLTGRALPGRLVFLGLRASTGAFRSRLRQHVSMLRNGLAGHRTIRRGPDRPETVCDAGPRHHQIVSASATRIGALPILYGRPQHGVADLRGHDVGRQPPRRDGPWRHPSWHSRRSRC
jgi:hypothetical protein